MPFADLLRRLFGTRSEAAQALFDDILYLSSRTHSLDELLKLFPERICAALGLSVFRILLFERGGYVLQHPQTAEEAQVVFPASCSTVYRMKRDRRPALFVSEEAVSESGGRDRADGWQMLAEPFEIETLTRLGARVLLPFEGRTRLMGFAVLARPGREVFSASELRFLRDLGPELGRGLETARMVQSISEQTIERARANRELELAREVQERLLPQVLPAIAGVDASAAYRSAEQVGGDYYDVFPTEDGTICLVVGDVSGKGVPAALLMAALRASVHALMVEPGVPVTRMMERLNGLLYTASSASRYATVFLCLYDPASARLTYVNAGHNPAMLLRADGQVERLTCGGTVVGLLPEVSFEAGTLTLEPGDTLVAYTDGVTEANSPEGEEWGEERLEASLAVAALDGERSAKDFVATVLRRFDGFVDGAAQTDDVTMVVFRRRAWGAGVERGSIG